MEDFIKDLAAREGWTDATTAAVLTDVLQQLVDMGAAEAADLRAMVLRRGGLDQADRPSVGDDVEMTGVETVIEIAGVPDDQPREADGVFTITDQYGESHLVEREREDGPWLVVIPAV